MSSDPLYVRDPEAWEAHLAEGNAKQARKRVGADVILLLDGELAEFRFCSEAQVSRLLRSSLWRRTQAAINALRTGQAPYLQDGNPT